MTWVWLGIGWGGRKSVRLDATRVLARLGATASVKALPTVDGMDEPVQCDRAV